MLDGSWLPDADCCPPNRQVYPHQWLWDSCFHAIAWAALGDERAVTELTSCFAAQLEGGFVPHMRYLGPTVGRGPLPDRSSFTQPPVFAHTARVLVDRGFAVPRSTLDAIGRALDWLWRERRTDDGLVFIVHPWESGADDSPRWDDWIGVPAYDKEAYRAVDRRLVDAAEFDAAGVACWSREFVVAPAAFNALVVHALREYAALTGDGLSVARADELGAACDASLWDDREQLWADRPVVGGGAGGGGSSGWPTLDGVLGALATPDEARANVALDQVLDEARFAAPFGVRYVPRGHPAYLPDQYWRGPAWPQLNYLVWVAAQRWGRLDVCETVARWSIAATESSALAEYWNPETGGGLGAVPQGWAALAATY
ncbi:MAG: hypothetical protein JO222_00325 [Frankiales bacterium]|nr:hypothetical protein [Frankiales bacterium]